jgi:hypothetical protein
MSVEDNTQGMAGKFAGLGRIRSNESRCATPSPACQLQKKWESRLDHVADRLGTQPGKK